MPDNINYLATWPLNAAAPPARGGAGPGGVGAPGWWCWGTPDEEWPSVTGYGMPLTTGFGVFGGGVFPFDTFIIALSPDRHIRENYVNGKGPVPWDRAWMLAAYLAMGGSRV